MAYVLNTDGGQKVWRVHAISGSWRQPCIAAVTLRIEATGTGIKRLGR